MNDKDLVLGAFKSRNKPIYEVEEVIDKWWVPLSITAGIPESWATMLFFLIAKQALDPKVEWIECRASEVARSTRVKKGYQSIILRRLQKKGLIERQRSTGGDARVRLVRVNYHVLVNIMGLKPKKEAA